MAKYWVVDVSIPSSRFESLDALFNLCKEVEDSVGGCGGAGFGFGFRDMDWTFQTKDEANEHEEKLINFFSERVIPTGDDDSDGDSVQIDVNEYDDED